MVTSGIGIAALIGLALVAGAVGFLVGRFAGKRAERRRWERRLAGEARELGRTRLLIRRALETGKPALRTEP